MCSFFTMPSFSPEDDRSVSRRLMLATVRYQRESSRKDEALAPDLAAFIARAFFARWVFWEFDNRGSAPHHGQSP
jgi:hypothetical protein